MQHMPADPGERAIYTIGYGHRTLDEFIALLNRYGIRYLGDVRSRPYSGFNAEFSRDSLAVNLERHGIAYVFLGDTLGGDPETLDVRRQTNRSRSETYAVDYDIAREQPAFRQGMKRLHSAWDQHLCLALMCSESRPEQCHRVRMIGVQMEDDGITVRHIDEDGKARSQEAIMLRIDKGQSTLPGFGLSARASRSSRTWKARDEAENDDPDLPNQDT